MHLNASSWLSVPRADVFPFFADPANLERLTPPWLRFRVLTPAPAVHEGLEITYRISLHGIPMRWVSQIQTYDPPRAFVDRQITGPYRTWVHTHRFFEERGGTRLTDDVQFDMIAGWLVGPLVARDLRRIFTYRHETLLRVFNQPQPWPAAAITFTR
jgi:ligand-binding SRPBCC domain-containing protein